MTGMDYKIMFIFQTSHQEEDSETAPQIDTSKTIHIYTPCTQIDTPYTPC